MEAIVISTTAILYVSRLICLVLTYNNIIDINYYDSPVRNSLSTAGYCRDASITYDMMYSKTHVSRISIIAEFERIYSSGSWKTLC